ncbi:MAG: hypothetical protein O7J95_09750, partial [Planctomycetota bacterium]|nr:hypothetical protein [Planctomycetota bacterium]
MLKPGASRSPRRGNALVLTLGVMTLLVGLAAAQFSIMQSNLRQSRFYLDRTVLHKYAETGIALAIHDVRHAISASPGNIGTETWDVTLDYGRDGVQRTQDDGEGDGVPTPGEPAVFAQPIGPPRLNILFVTAVLDSGFANVQRIVATVVSDEGLVRVEKYLQTKIVQIPREGAAYVAPDVLLNFQGSRFLIDGRDHDLTGALSGGPSTWGMATAPGATSGENATQVVSQIPS